MLCCNYLIGSNPEVQTWFIQVEPQQSPQQQIFRGECGGDECVQFAEWK